VALTATVYNFRIDLSDMDRGVYETIDLRMAQQPSESIEYLLMRLLAYCLEFEDGILLTEGVAAGNEPAVLVRDLTGNVTAWIEVGMPDAERLHRGMKLAGRAAVYTHRDVRKLLAQLTAGKIHKADAIPVYAIDRTFVDNVAARLERRSEISMSITDHELYLNIAGQNFTTVIAEHRITLTI
jgi:uncharacterized protein YaeQ